MQKAAAVSLIKTLDEPAFSFPVTAQQLGEIPAPPVPVALAASDPVVTVADVSPEAAQRTDIVGAGDGSMRVDRVVVTGAAREIPHKAPDLSREQAASLVCRAARFGGGWLDKAQRAYRATLAAYDARTAYEAGTGTLKAANDAERKRQDAVLDASGPNFLFDLFGAKKKKADLAPPASDGFVLESVDLFTFRENGQSVMAVSGVVRNTSDRTAQVPPVTLHAIDRWEFILASQSLLPPFLELAPGEAKAFELRFLNPPDTTAEVFANFAPPFEVRARRDCEGLDPAAITAETPAPLPSAPASSPVHTAAELNTLAQVYHRDAAAAWDCREGRNTPPPANGLKVASTGGGERRGLSISIGFGKADMAERCKPFERRMRWRDLFLMGEAADEAWNATLAAETARKREAQGSGSQAEVDGAAAAQVAAGEHLRVLAQSALQRVGSPAPDVKVEVASAVFAHEKAEGRWVDVSGRLTNTGAEPRRVEALMVALVDRLDFPIVSFGIEKPLDLAPGQSVDFKERVMTGEPVRWQRVREQPDWQVRVGAMGR